ncbi:class I SAM-dependent methyltransferase [Saccharothrix deserti]|uniref:class I SAM-dependent methyltransferase n=1 Tax=Saccharothrix deserti TaxID=2593674 RepID=UPI00131C48EB|nr:methyltransferase domain-containing protein [Saccharothrix deserti]
MTTETFRISAEQAEVYEEKFVPALFTQWTEPLLDLAGVRPGERVLDVACGTGVLTRRAADRVGPTGRVVGLDLGDGMLTVARRLRPDLDWRQGDAAAMPFADGAFDRVLCQSGLMFFPDTTRALHEMGRVCAADGVVGLQVYSSLDRQPAYGPWVETVARHTGPEAVSLLSTYWSQGDLDELAAHCARAGLEVADSHSLLGTARWDSIDQMVRTEVNGTPLADRIDSGVFERVLAESRELLAPYATRAGAAVPIRAEFVVARKR